MFSKKWQRRLALLLFVAYSLDLVWKLLNWDESFGLVPWWGVVLGLSFRFVFMGFILFLYLRARESSPSAQTASMEAVTPQARAASGRSVRFIYRIFFAVIVMYFFLTEWLFTTETGASVAFVVVFYLMAAAMASILYLVRKKMLRLANEAIARNPNDAQALARWRGANILGMVGAVSISMFGLALRAVGGNRLVAWPFFVAAIVLMFLLRPSPEVGLGAIEGSGQ